MLFLVTSPPVMHPGTYTCQEISTDEAATVIQEASESGRLKPYVNFGSTRFAIQQLTGIKVELVQKISVPVPMEGDSILDIRLKEKPTGGKMRPEDLAFFLIDFVEKMTT